MSEKVKEIMDIISSLERWQLDELNKALKDKLNPYYQSVCWMSFPMYAGVPYEQGASLGFFSYFTGSPEE